MISQTRLGHRSDTQSLRLEHLKGHSAAAAGAGTGGTSADPGGAEQHLCGSSGMLALGGQLHPLPQ